ncbi:MAG: hypothetical protein E7003_06840 [Eggerthellaceae bacterium]|nr:hypothetical protein [Eggerthellaceae bacterium]
MAIVELSDEQTRLLKGLGLPTVISTDMPDEQWCGITERLLDEVQMRGLNERFDGENEYGLLCSSVYMAMIDADDAV